MGLTFMPSVKDARILIGGCGCSKVLEMWQGELDVHLLMMSAVKQDEF